MNYPEWLRVAYPSTWPLIKPETLAGHMVYGMKTRESNCVGVSSSIQMVLSRPWRCSHRLLAGDLLNQSGRYRHSSLYVPREAKKPRLPVGNPASQPLNLAPTWLARSGRSGNLEWSKNPLSSKTNIEDFLKNEDDLDERVAFGT
jgi:hypothetical protein